jgi:hypothetical protein
LCRWYRQKPGCTRLLWLLKKVYFSLTSDGAGKAYVRKTFRNLAASSHYLTAEENQSLTRTQSLLKTTHNQCYKQMTNNQFRYSADSKVSPETLIKTLLTSPYQLNLTSNQLQITKLNVARVTYKSHLISKTEALYQTP